MDPEEIDEFREMLQTIESEELEILLEGAFTKLQKLNDALRAFFNDKTLETTNVLRLRDAWVQGILQSANPKQKRNEFKSKCEPIIAPLIHCAENHIRPLLENFDSGLDDSILTLLNYETDEIPKIVVTLRLTSEQHVVLQTTRELLRKYDTLTSSADEIELIFCYRHNELSAYARLDFLSKLSKPSCSERKLADYISKLTAFLAETEAAFQELKSCYNEIQLSALDDETKNQLDSRQHALEQKCEDFFNESADYCRELQSLLAKIYNKNTEADTLLTAIYPTVTQQELFHQLAGFFFCADTENERHIYFRIIINIACLTRPLAISDFHPTDLPQNPYEVKADLFIRFLVSSRFFRAMIHKDLECLDTAAELCHWLGETTHLDYFVTCLTTLFNRIQDPQSPEEAIFAENIVNSAETEMRKISERPISRMSFFSPSLAYDQSEAANTICRKLAGNLELQQFLFGYEGEQALDEEGMRHWLEKNQRLLRKLNASNSTEARMRIA